ncbi:MAG TPA: RNA polymerase sigma factor [Bryobacteraceae bacterium]|nr:RNA polymerase sigma factor [Bryobacteraceae bacterium]
MASEFELAELAARGDVGAFQAIWNAHRAAIYRFACWMLRDPAAAEDVTQECFLVLLQRPGRFDPARASLRTLLLAIARNQCSIRRRKAQLETGLADEGADLPAPELATAQLASAECAAILNAAIANLPPLQREALFLFEYEGLSLEDAAAVAGTDTGTLKSRLYRGRQRLKRELSWLAKEGF